MNKQILTFNINETDYEAIVSPNMTLNDVIRDKLGLTGTKESCQVGECGACTVLADGVPILACSTLAIAVRDKKILTIEGLANGQNLHQVQQAFIDHGASQCGFCTPGQIMMSVALLNENPDPTRQEVKEWLGGNLCRCTGYVKIVDAVMAAAATLKQEAGR